MRKRPFTIMLIGGSTLALAGTVAIASTGHRDHRALHHARVASSESTVTAAKFSVLRSAVTGADALDASIRLSGAPVDRTQSHRVAVSSGLFSAWIVPGPNTLCVAVTERGGAGAACNPLALASRGLAMTLGGSAGTNLVLGVVPDGVTGVTLHMKSGQTYPLSVHGNAYTARVAGATDSVTYTDAGGPFTQPLPSLTN